VKVSRTKLLAAFIASLPCLALAQSGAVIVAEDNMSMTVSLPDSAFAAEGASLSIDLDGYDISEFVRLDGTTLLIDLDSPVGAGERSLTVYLFHASGEAEIVLEDVLLIESTGVQWEANTTFQTNYRADESSEIDFDGVDDTSNSGSVSLRAEKSSGNWQFGAAVDAIYDTENAVLPGDDRWMLPDYQLRFAYGNDRTGTSLSAGNIYVSRDDLLFSGYNRRGAALEAGMASGRIQLQMFSLNSTPKNGLDGDYFYPGDSNDESNGVSGTVTIVNEHLFLSGGFVDGKTTFGGAGFNEFDDPVIYGGDSWNVALDGYWMSDSIWIHAETAESTFDSDGIGIGLSESDDEATQIALQLSSDGDLGYGPFNYWSVYYQYQRIGIDFFSLGNMSLPGNLDIRSFYFQGGFDSLSVDFEVTREMTNPDDDPALPTQTLRRAGVNLSYAPAVINPDNALWATFGAPSLTLRLYETQNRQPFSDALLAGYDLSNFTEETGAGLAFAKETVSWSLQYDIIDYDDSSQEVFDGGFLIYEPLSDNRNHATSVQASWAPGERVALDAMLQWNDLEEFDSGDEFQTKTWSLSGNFVLVPERLSFYASVSQGRDENRFGDPQFIDERFRNRFASVQFNWAALVADGSRPGLDVFLKGNWMQNDDLSFMTESRIWSVYLGAAVNWAGSKQ
jgi:hypothetical protein